MKPDKSFLKHIKVNVPVLLSVRRGSKAGRFFVALADWTDDYRTFPDGANWGEGKTMKAAIADYLKSVREWHEIIGAAKKKKKGK